MKYVLKPHAKRRLQERSIPESVLRGALENPTRLGYDDNGRLLIKKLYKKHDQERMLLIAGEFVGEVLEIITVIDTSKVKKYL